MLARAFVVLGSLGLAACATATERNPDASDGDGSVRHDAPISHGDAPTSGCSFTGALATWNMAGLAGNEVSVVAATMATGVTAGSLTRAAGLTATAAMNTISSSGWPTAATRDSTKYYAFTLTPPSGCSLKLTTLSIDTAASSTGPATTVLATSADAFTATTSISPTAVNTPALTATSSATLEIHVYGYAATSAAGTFKIQNMLTVNGSIQ